MGAGEIPDAQQKSPELRARHFVLTTVWQGLSELADRINADPDRIATLTMDPAADLGTVSLRVYPVGSQPAQATPLFRYDVTGSVVGSGVSVRFAAEPAVVNSQVRRGERGDLAIRAPGDQPP